MEVFAKGEIVFLPFPFSNLAGVKVRPALIVAMLDGGEIVLCQVTSKERRDHHAIPITQQDVEGILPLPSNIRPNKLFTGNTALVNGHIGVLSREKLKEVEETIVGIIRK